MALRKPTLDDVFLTLTSEVSDDHLTARGAAAPTRPGSAGRPQLIFVGRSLRHSVRNVDALIMAIALPVILMLLFVYVFGGAIEPGGGYVDYVVPGIILLCAGFGAAGTAVAVADGHDQRRDRPVPHDADRQFAA